MQVFKNKVDEKEKNWKVVWKKFIIFKRVIEKLIKYFLIEIRNVKVKCKENFIWMGEKKFLIQNRIVY